MSFRLRSLIAVALGTLIIGLIASFPARVAYSWFAPVELQLAGIDGTVWRGTAAEGKTGGVYLRNLRWDFKPSALFSGKLAFATKLDPAGGFMSSDIFVALDGSLLFRDLDCALPISALRNLIQTPGLDGRIRVRFSELEISDGTLVTAEGIVEISNLFIRGLAAITIGDYEAKFNTGSDGIVASIEDTSGMFDLAGTLDISPNGFYSLTGLIAPTAMTPPRVVEQLRLLGSPNARGQREFRFEGEI